MITAVRGIRGQPYLHGELCRGNESNIVMTYTNQTIPTETHPGIYLIASYQQYRLALTYSGYFTVSLEGLLMFIEIV